MSSSSSAADKMQEELDRQQQEAAAEAAKKLQALTKTRLEIVRSAGAQQWSNPDAPAQETEEPTAEQ